ncbi:MAG TPA: type I DNA topoisomerase [Gemmatimonadales bacterium]|jgi:DNA topoisomerase-1|nr:type I DNA topoisomerase [Gemmatimonadales bacterium]
MATRKKAATKSKAARARAASPGGGLGRALVIVESPTKARTISGFLPDGYTVAASMGHVRDLPGDAKEIPARYKGEEWARFGVNVANDFEPLYVIPADKRPVVKELKELLKDADKLYLATDEDREGESISWHLLDVLQPKIPVQRMVFHEITREAIEEALAHTREVNLDLVHAQETRRILDRLVGYTLSPLLWKKVAFGLSAGRVQSVATRLIVDRERERLAFRTGSYWDLTATLERQKETFDAGMIALDGKRLATGKDFDEQTGRLAKDSDVVLLDETTAKALVERLAGAAWRVTSVEESPRTVRPYAPFTTSTLQQEANRKLRYSAKQTMQVAQRLYERGYITYMRTDSVALSDQAINAARSFVGRLYGKEYLPESPRRYANKVANAQEAHEAIRPAGATFRTPEETGLDGEEFTIYDLIWKRTVASQMTDARKTSTTVEISALNTTFKASGLRTDFAGFLRAYVEGSDDPEAALEDKDTPLPPLAVGDTPACRALEPVGHETKPPARFTEASLVKALEENGVGRPSTYASIIGTIVDRGYVVRQGQALVPTFTAFAVTDLLIKHFGHLVDVEFTKEMENNLDEIAAGDGLWLEYLRKFYLGSEGLQEQTARGERDIKPAEARVVALDGLGATVRIGRFGPYVEREENGEPLRASLPRDATPADISPERVETLLRQRAEGPPSVGVHPETNEPIYVIEGQYGPYVQLGEVSDDKKPKRASLPKGVKPEDATLEMAIGLLALPRLLGNHPESGRPVKAGLGRFGPYILHDLGKGTADFRSLKAGDDVLTVSLERALQLLAEPKAQRGRRGANATPLRELGAHPADSKPVQLFDGKYGPYVKHGDLNASLPRGADPQQFSLDAAVALLAEKGKAPKSAGRGGARTRRRVPSS